MKRSPKFIAEQFSLPFEPHKIIQCAECEEMHELEFRRSGDNELYYRCGRCGFESAELGKVSDISIARLGAKIL